MGTITAGQGAGCSVQRGSGQGTNSYGDVHGTRMSITSNVIAPFPVTPMANAVAVTRIDGAGFLANTTPVAETGADIESLLDHFTESAVTACPFALCTVIVSETLAQTIRPPNF